MGIKMREGKVWRSFIILYNAGRTEFMQFSCPVPELPIEVFENKLNIKAAFVIRGTLK